MTYNTEGRRRILEFLEKNREASYTVAEIIEGSGVSKSSIYRNVKELLDMGLIGCDPDTQDGHVKYRYAGGACAHHLHLKCSGCGGIIHLDHELTHSISELIFSGIGFKINGKVALLGECENCLKTKEGGEK